METAQYPNVDAVKIAPLFSLMDAPIFHADSSPWSRALNITLYGLVFISIWQVTGALIRQTWKYQRLPQRKAISGLLLLAILSTSVVFTMRCEHILPTILMQNGVWWYSYSKSAWKSFDQLVDVPRSRYFAYQWYMGYLSWSAYVAVECKRRSLGALVAFSLIFLGFCISLSGTQYIFYVLALLSPRLDTEVSFLETFPILLALAGLVEATILLVFPYLPRTNAPDPSPWWKSSTTLHNGLQLLLILLPAFVALLAFRAWKPIRRRSLTAAKKTLYCAWHVISVLSIGMHLYTAYEAYRAINTGRDVGWGQLTCLLPWHSQHANGLKRWQKSSLRGFGLLGNNAWISSVAWDIVFSGIGICTWSIISASEPRGMIGCSVFPWRADVEQAAAQNDGNSSVEEPTMPQTRNSQSSQTQSSAINVPAIRRSRRLAAIQPSPELPLPSRMRMRRGERDAGSQIDSASQSLTAPAAFADRPEASDSEAACLALALWMIGGLGMCSAAVFGAEENLVTAILGDLQHGPTAQALIKATPLFEEWHLRRLESILSKDEVAGEDLGVLTDRVYDLRPSA